MSRPPSRGRGGGGGRGRGRGGPRGGGRGGRSESRPRNTSKLFIGNMPETVRRSDLQALFDKYGDVIECDIVKDFAFVHYATVQEAQKAVDNLHQTEFQGSEIRVELSHSHVRTKPGMGDKNECYRCGQVGHWSKDCPDAPPERREREQMRDGGRDGGRRDGGGGRDRDPYSRRERDPYARDPAMVARDPYARDPYSRGALAVRDPYARDPYSRDPYARDMSERDPYARDPYARAGLADRYGRESARFDPYSRRAPPREPPAHVMSSDPYARPPPDYYRKPAAPSPTFARDPYSRAALLPAR